MPIQQQVLARGRIHSGHGQGLDQADLLDRRADLPELA
jgi:hypothetical protein